MADAHDDVKEMVDPGTALALIDGEELKKRSTEILAMVVKEDDPAKMQDLTSMFQMNQRKKTMVRMEKYDELADVLTDRLIERVKNDPDRIPTEQLMGALKTVSGLLSNGMTQIVPEQTAPQAPVINIADQHTEVNVEPNGLNRASRDKVKDVVLSLLQNAGIGPNSYVMQVDENVIDAEGEGNDK